MNKTIINMKFLVISFVIASANICLAAKLHLIPAPSKESPSTSHESSSPSYDSLSPLVKELLSPKDDSLSPLVKELPSPSNDSLSPLAKELLSPKDDSLSPTKGFPFPPPSPSYDSPPSPYLPPSPPSPYGSPFFEGSKSRYKNYPARKQELPGSGSLEIYENFNWTEATPSSSPDLELLQTWNSSDWKVLDLVLIMDCTGSMSAWIEHSKTTLKSVIDDIVKENEDLKVRVAFVGFRDFGDGDDIFSIQDFTFDIPTVKSFISEQRASGGGDLAEDVTGGLHQTLQLSWYPGSVRLASIIADAPTHGNQYHDIGGDKYPEGSPAGITLEGLVEEFKEREIALTLYKLTDQTEKMYNFIKNTYDSEDFVTFVDIRDDINKSVSAGLGYSSDAVKTAYKSKSSNAYRRQYSAQAISKGWVKGG